MIPCQSRSCAYDGRRERGGEEDGWGGGGWGQKKEGKCNTTEVSRLQVMFCNIQQCALAVLWCCFQVS